MSKVSKSVVFVLVYIVVFVAVVKYCYDNNVDRVVSDIDSNENNTSTNVNNNYNTYEKYTDFADNIDSIVDVSSDYIEVNRVKGENGEISTKEIYTFVAELFNSANLVCGLEECSNSTQEIAMYIRKNVSKPIEISNISIEYSKDNNMLYVWSKCKSADGAEFNSKITIDIEDEVKKVRSICIVSEKESINGNKYVPIYSVGDTYENWVELSDNVLNSICTKAKSSTVQIICNENGNKYSVAGFVICKGFVCTAYSNIHKNNLESVKAYNGSICNIQGIVYTDKIRNIAILKLSEQFGNEADISENAEYESSDNYSEPFVVDNIHSGAYSGVIEHSSKNGFIGCINDVSGSIGGLAYDNFGYCIGIVNKIYGIDSVSIENIDELRRIKSALNDVIFDLVDVIE